ncbi:MAG: site-specific integrase [Ignavibacteriales bacterium]|nr:site-specific integrase [Ignavibacteriales bacterium]
MEENVQKILNQFSFEEIEKLKRLLLIIPDASQNVNVAKPIEVVTLKIFFDEYSHQIKMNHSKAYHASVILSLMHLTDFFGDQKLIQSIGLREVEKFMIYIQQKVKKGYVVYFRNLKAAFNQAKNWGYIGENYFLKIKLPRRQKTAPAYLNNDQLLLLSSQIENQKMKEIVVTAFFTGMRLSEITNLTWRNVDLTKRIITVGDENFITKSRSQRYIPMTAEVYEILIKKNEKKMKVFKQNEDYIFCKNDGKKFTGDYISKIFKRACGAAGISKSIHFHSLRHSFASNLAQKGISLYIIKELLGHTSVSTTEIYAHLNMDSLKDAIKVLETSSYSSLSKIAPTPNDFSSVIKIDSNSIL